MGKATEEVAADSLARKPPIVLVAEEEAFAFLLKTVELVQRFLVARAKMHIRLQIDGMKGPEGVCEIEIKI